MAGRCRRRTTSTGSSWWRRRRPRNGWRRRSRRHADSSTPHRRWVSPVRVTRCRWLHPNWFAGSRRFRTFRSVSGLGVRSREQAAQIGAYADGVIVGSALVSALADGLGAVRSLTEELADGVRQKDYRVTTTVLAYIPSPSRASGISVRFRSGRTRCSSSSASSRRWSSATVAGWPAAASAASSTTSRCGRCRSA